MNWLSRLVSRGEIKASVRTEFLPQGVLLRSDPQQGVDAGRLVLQQLAGAEELTEFEDGLLWPWESVYSHLDTSAQDVFALGLPPLTDVRPNLVSRGSLVDRDFTVAFDGWDDGAGNRYASASTAGGVAFLDDSSPVLLKRATYELVRKLADFYLVKDRDELSNRRAWAALRECALACGARLDSFLASTVVLTPQKLQLRFDRTESGGVDVATIEPWFEGAPVNWLTVFDESRLQDRYDIPTDQGIVQVLVSDDVKCVLAGVKALPGRRVAGRFAEKFLQNPIAALGEAASRVLDAEQVEQAREHAGIRYQRFSAKVSAGDEGVREVGLLIESAGLNEAESHYERFKNASELGAFINGVKTRLATLEEVYRWRRYDLQLLGDTEREVETLSLAYLELTRPRVTIRFADVADLRRYSERVAGIGVQHPLVSPYLPKRQDSTWFPEDVVDAAPPVHVTLQDVTGTPFDVVVTPAVKEEVNRRVEQAKASGATSIEWPETHRRVPIDGCEEVIDQVAGAWKERPTVGRDVKPSTGVRPSSRKELLLRANIESTDYKEQRAIALRFDASSTPRLPHSLKPDVELMPHQQVGVAWLQNLLRQAPDYCRGAVLADDMGLGKTFQLLTVIAASIEEKKPSAPALVVAPVALLENWKEEAAKFFRPGTFKMLTLYGPELAARRERRDSIDPELLKDGIASFLKPGWVGEHDVVLTTYETLRDLEFSFAAERWSIIVCDEAQKIKNPAAMMTRAAKKQQAEFRIACTGTPVENTLIDLWCLFDWVQPGLLGSLNEFGRTYRRPIECKEDEERQRVEELRALVDCQVLRRMKKDVAKELREKIIDKAALNLRMSEHQRRLYSKALEQFKNRKDTSRPTPFKDHLTLLQYLRLVCTDPREYGTVFTKPEPLKEYRRKSPKLDWLLTTLEQVRRRDEKAIIFCEFRDIQRMLAHYLNEAFGFTPDIINGDTSASAEHTASRQKRIAAFQRSPGFGAIVLSPLAVGFGVNIQAANHVIHYTRTWNPAKEDQATDRAYRIGQKLDVYVYYPVVRADFVTFDHKLHDLLEQKRALSHDMLNGTGDVRPTDFTEVIAIGGDVFDERITIDDAQRMDWRHFEALCAILWRKRFKAVQLTPGSSDGGVDVVAWTRSAGELVQVKTSSAEGAELNFDAVKEVVAARPVYERKFPGIAFKLVCATNQRFSASAKQLAEMHDVRLVEANDVDLLLREHRVTISDVHRMLQTDAVFSG